MENLQRIKCWLWSLNVKKSYYLSWNSLFCKPIVNELCYQQYCRDVSYIVQITQCFAELMIECVLCWKYSWNSGFHCLGQAPRGIVSIACWNWWWLIIRSCYCPFGNQCGGISIHNIILDGFKLCLVWTCSRMIAMNGSMHTSWWCYNFNLGW